MKQNSIYAINKKDGLGLEDQYYLIKQYRYLILEMLKGGKNQSKYLDQAIVRIKLTHGCSEQQALNIIENIVKKSKLIKEYRKIDKRYQKYSPGYRNDAAQSVDEKPLKTYKKVYQ